MALAISGGCAPHAQVPTPTGGAGDASFDAQVSVIEGGAEAGGCTSTIENHPEEGFVHVPCTDAVDYQTDPPSSGDHYICWAAYQTYAAPIPWGNLVHSLEHGAVIIVYNCPDGCADEVAAIQAFIDSLPLDADCGPSLGKNRIILMPDPALDVRFAATAWTWTLRATCFDPVAFRQFFDAHYDHGREIICSDGWPTAELCSDDCL